MLVLEVGLKHLLTIFLAQLTLDKPAEEIMVSSDGFGGDEFKQRGSLREELFVEIKHETELEGVVDRGLHVYFHQVVENLAKVLLVELPINKA